MLYIEFQLLKFSKKSEITKQVKHTTKELTCTKQGISSKLRLYLKFMINFMFRIDERAINNNMIIGELLPTCINWNRKTSKNRQCSFQSMLHSTEF